MGGVDRLIRKILNPGSLRKKKVEVLFKKEGKPCQALILFGSDEWCTE